MKNIFTLCLFTLAGLTLVAQCDDRYTTALFTDFEVIEDVAYGSSIELDGDVKDLVFDFYAPANDELEERPLIIWAHGGTFISGDEDDLRFLGEHFAALGYANASINYRLAEVVFENLQIFDNNITELMADELIKATQDMRAAIRFFRRDAAENGNQYGIDVDQIYVGGVSAGAITAVHVAYMDDLEGAESIAVDLPTLIEANGGLEGDSGNPGFSSEVSGVINFSGALASVDLIQADEVPLVSVHDTEDGVVPFAIDTVVVFSLPVIEMEGSQVMHERADELGVTNDLLSFDQALHVGYFGTDLDESLDHVVDFMADLVTCPTQETTGIEEIPYDISVFPTVVEDFVNVRLDSNEEVAIRIFDINGKEVLTRTAVANAQINVGELVNGFYFLTVQDGEFQSTEKFIVK